MKFGNQQETALKSFSNWFHGKPKGWFYLAGFAGTGKTTLAKHLADEVGGYVTFMAFTGKAAQVMRNNGCYGARTIHSSIYNRRQSPRQGQSPWIFNPDAECGASRLIIIDECSMVDEQLGSDLLRYRVPILVLGDPFQLPPVDGAGFFTKRDPDVLLTDIHRQAEDNPIIRLSMQVREGEPLLFGSFGDSKVIPRKDVVRSEVMAADQVLVGRNITRVGHNLHFRKLKGFDGKPPQKGERLICTRNNNGRGMFNGSMWNVVKNARLDKYEDITCYEYPAEALDEGAEVHGSQWMRTQVEHFTGRKPPRVPGRIFRDFDEMLFGYAITVHKSQGSQWNNVVLWNEAGAFREDAARWLYTGITRAAERITIVT